MNRLLISLVAGLAASVAQAGESFRFASIDGGMIDLADWRGKPVLVVNTASLCGYAGQFDGLQALHERFGDRALILAVPSNDFEQELEDEAAVKEYPYPDRYHVWPGPNSNTFVAFVARKVPELRVDLPPTAIGKDYLGWKSVGRTPSGTGGQASLFGVLGVSAGLEEGVEVNLLGLSLGVDPKSLSVKLPIVGRLGPKRDDTPVMLPASVKPVAAAD